MSGSNPTPYGYKAQWGYHADVETGILLLTHRYFDPATGRFLTRDPAGCEASVNLYAYVGNNAMNKVDPSGLWCLHLGWGHCIGTTCHGDPQCKPRKPRPKPTPPHRFPSPPNDVCIRNPRPTDLPPGCFPLGKTIVCKPEDCFANFSPRFGPWTKERCMDCCHAGRYVWSRHQLHYCESLCESEFPHIPEFP